MTFINSRFHKRSQPFTKPNFNLRINRIFQPLSNSNYKQDKFFQSRILPYEHNKRVIQNASPLPKKRLNPDLNFNNVLFNDVLAPKRNLKPSVADRSRSCEESQIVQFVEDNRESLMNCEMRETGGEDTRPHAEVKVWEKTATGLLDCWILVAM